MVHAGPIQVLMMGSFGRSISEDSEFVESGVLLPFGLFFSFSFPFDPFVFSLAVLLVLDLSACSRHFLRYTGVPGSGPGGLM